MAKESMEQLIYEETEKRLSIMEAPDYEFPPKMSKIDVVGIVGAILICLVLIILCMVGVID